MRVYISGAITFNPDYKEDFASAEEKLTENGIEVFNPAKTDAVLPKCMTYAEIMKIDLDLLDMCDAIFMLNGWQYSKGAKIELEHAIKNDKKIYLETDGYYVSESNLAL